MTSVYSAYALKHYFDEIHYIDILDCNGGDHGYPFATNFNPEINLREVSAMGSYWEDGHWVEVEPVSYTHLVDSATRLYNKNKYEDMLANYYTMVERVAVVLWDINNLKEINDRMGHGMGDKLIETMSGAIYVQTDKRKKAYRIGGDEFVMLIENPEDVYKRQYHTHSLEVYADSIPGDRSTTVVGVGDYLTELLTQQ